MPISGRFRNLIKRLAQAVLLAILVSTCHIPCLYAGKVIEHVQKGYCLGAPKPVLEGRAMPVLICLPGSGIEASNDINTWVFQANKRGFFVIDFDVNYSNIVSENDLKALYRKIQDAIANVSKEYNIDKNKIFIAGTSAGGMMAISLALYFPGSFKAIGVVSGARLKNFGAEARLKNAKGQLFYLYHGGNDKIVPINELYNSKKKLEKYKAVVESKVLEAGEHTLPQSCYKEMVDWLFQLSELSM